LPVKSKAIPDKTWEFDELEVRRCTVQTREASPERQHVFNHWCALTGLCCLQGKLEELEKELVESNSNMSRLQRSYAELVELQLVLDKAGSFFDSKTAAQFEASIADSIADGESPLLDAQVSS
jgi:hypothetical protein